MGDIVCDGTSFSCPLCTAKLKITVISSSAEGESKKLANTGNFLFPPPPGGLCQLPGVVPPPPCAPPSVSVIDPGQSAVEIDGQKALDAGCQLLCAMAPMGMLTVSSSGQSAAIHGGAEEGKTVEEALDVAVIEVPTPR